jgi:rhamnogalacturonyl hydrolase YesR
VKPYLTTFLLVSVGAGVLAHFVTRYPMPWWPDTVIMGLPFGILAALSAWQHHRTNRLIWNALKGAIHRRRKAA